ASSVSDQYKDNGKRCVADIQTLCCALGFQEDVQTCRRCDVQTIRQPRCCDHQVRQAAGSAVIEAPVISRNAWNTQPRVVASSVLSSVICSSSGTALNRCCRFSMPDCANPQPPRSRTSAEGSPRNASSN